MTEVGIRSTEWAVHRSLIAFGGSLSGVYARFRGRDGLLFVLFMPMAEELLEAIELGQVEGAVLLRSTWQEFRWQLDRRYDDSYVFWPRRGIGKGRWAA